MNDQSQSDEAKYQAIHRRLDLARDILEDSDKLPGYAAITDDGSPYLKHPRHDREALVIYLLLTCFDLLGQLNEYRTFKEWLESNSPEHEAQRGEVVSCLNGSESPAELSLAFAKAYDRRFGVRNSFFEGIENLSQSGRDLLLDSIYVFEDKEWKKRSASTSPGVIPSNRPEEELRKLKLSFLFTKRNRFTHSLEQQDHLSAPHQSVIGLGLFDEDRLKRSDVGACWIASLSSAGLKYHCSFWDKIPRRKSLMFKVLDWPFALFEVLHDQVGIPFDRTSLNLNFQVYLPSDRNMHPRWSSVPHSSLHSLSLDELSE